ncbi:isoleucine--tRNA ligase [bacterium]|nr:isoleucine--tRNA ligase [bacterium]NBX97744.1 isoleucine--tRNA ligase [bacterium]NDC94950.1 isoleucine--tRNA ligase [bacterium]NDD84685.1 isoleucine--tRNA ligase [bacterium]NDG30779.1 isoleucine--tRNA ligase [bacterium]
MVPPAKDASSRDQKRDFYILRRKSMKFQKNTRRKAAEYEKDLVRYWKENKTFEKSVSRRPEDSAYVFYDGPPFITGVPHTGTLLSSIIKDAVPRYQTMKGHRVERVWGWDCHGLPAEVFTEKKLGITDKREIGSKISLQDYIVACRDNMVATGDLWEDTIDRIGRWVDFKGAYKTMDKQYMESVWWAFKTLYDKGKIYEGEKVLLYCTRDATPISKAEVAMDNSYQVVTDPSVYVKFKLVGDEAYLLAWTTTPWTLNANTAIAVNKDVTYVRVQVGHDQFILAKSLINKALTDEKHNVVTHTILGELQGSELVGMSYVPLFANRGHNAHKVWHADFVTDQDGTGIAHEAPAYGEDDYAMAKANKISMVLDTDDEGFYTEGPFKGSQIWEVNKQIAKDLHAQGVVWKIDYIAHEYPHCHRCGTKLQYRAHPSWFMDINGQRTEMLEQNGNVTWFPEHIKHGRFTKTVESAPDWNLSRDRFWATAMPVWKGVDAKGVEHIKVVGSYAELKELSGVELNDYHRPWIDDVTFTIDSVTYKRIDKVMDCWFESGSMPFAQFHYPFENVQKFEANFPGDFIVEYVGQVRAWFYYMHAVNVGLFGKNAFKNVIVTGTIAGNDGRKMSKSLGNFTDPTELMDTYSADALRFLLLSTPVVAGEDFALQDKDVNDVNRKLSMVWNMYDFFTLYADVDGWEFNGELGDPTAECTNPLDTWIISRMHQLITEVGTHMDRYDLQNAIKPILPFIDDASNWYVRRSRKRFWKSGDDADKHMAYRTLHYVLTQLAHVMAPFTPFMAEELYRNLTGGESVHLNDWPVAGHVNELVLGHMNAVRTVINDGLSQRASAGIKVRQPLASAKIRQMYEFDASYDDIVSEELNVKQVLHEARLLDPSKNFEQNLQEQGLPQVEAVELDLEITPELHREGMMREVIRAVQNARKEAGLEVDDRINLSLQTDIEQLQKAISEHQDTIVAETLAHGLQNHVADGLTKTVKIEGHELTLHLAKA